MNKEQSLYLDILRFGAAMVVFLSHVSSQKISGGIFWQLKDYDQTAVMIFFAMSGYVIAFVTQSREKTLSVYTVSRISRLYSIVIPALVLTYVADSIGLNFNPNYYLGGPWPYSLENQGMDYLMSFFLINNIWGKGYTPGINGPFWSLTFELFYYMIFAVLFYLKSKIKYILAILLAVIAGPTIIVLFPIWLMGYFLYFAMHNDDLNHSNSNLKALLSLLALFAFIFLGPMVREFHVAIPFISRKELIGDYFDATLFCLHLYFAPSALRYIKSILFKFESVIRWSAALTFALYLFHRPLIQLFGALSPVDVSNWIYRITMIVGTFLIVATFGHWCEKQKYILKKALNHLTKQGGSIEKLK